MKRLVPLVLVIACAELRQAEDAPPGAVTPASDASVSIDARANDGTDAGTSAPDANVKPGELCDASCPTETIVKLPNSFGPIAVDDANVYFSDPGKVTAMCPKTGCPTMTVLMNSGGTEIALAAGNVFIGSGTKLLSCAKTGCKPGTRDRPRRARSRRSPGQRWRASRVARDCRRSRRAPFVRRPELQPRQCGDDRRRDSHHS